MAATDPAEFVAYRAQIEAAGGIDTEVIAARYRDWGAADLRDWFAAAGTGCSTSSPASTQRSVSPGSGRR